VKVAVAALAADKVNTQVPDPVQPPVPLHASDPPAVGVPVSVTTVPSAKSKEVEAMLLIPAGELVTVPVPVPATVNVKV
jgi:hypothetical protein